MRPNVPFFTIVVFCFAAAPLVIADEHNKRLVSDIPPLVNVDAFDHGTLQVLDGVPSALDGLLQAPESLLSAVPLKREEETPSKPTMQRRKLQALHKRMAKRQQVGKA